MHNTQTIIPQTKPALRHFPVQTLSLPNSTYGNSLLTLLPQHLCLTLCLPLWVGTQCTLLKMVRYCTTTVCYYWDMSVK